MVKINLPSLAPIREEIKKVRSSRQLEKARIKYLGRRGLFNQYFAQLASLPPNERKKWGQKLNQLKKTTISLIEQKQKELPKEEKETPSCSPSLQNAIFVPQKFGHLHPITIIERELNAFFQSLGFSIYTGPEIETDEFCFQRLNVPPDHPARDLQDTIYIKSPQILLTTQTSSIEAHLLANEKPPFRAAFPGRVYRNEKVTRSNHFIFHQYQGVAVDKEISIKDLIGVLDSLFKHMYGSQAVVRYRCKYYPEVEPGVGFDLRCFSCRGRGCSLCKGVGWIEMGGAGIIHPKVMEMAGLNPRQWRGFAFGLGLDRWVMAKYKIEDIRTLLGGNLAYKPFLP